ncbi:MAG TPA: DUF2617 family protein [Planctomycetaceae bacterium]|nr:DUF2617 family protein [Planctomycetaceae bacterium]
MSVGFARPDVGNLVFHLFGRSVHPELYANFAQAEVRQPNYSAVLRICDAGHVLTFQYRQSVLTEVMTTRQSPLPQKKRLLAHRLKDHRCETLQHDEGLQYHVSIQVETLEPEVFQHFHQELLADSCRSQLAHRFGSKSRLAPAPLSFIQTDEGPRSLFVHTFHTYPDNCAVVKTQSLFEF